MKRILFLAIIFFIVPNAFATLPPSHQNMEDLDVMVRYIKEHRDVAATLESIDLSEYTIYYGPGCKAVFGRKPLDRPKGMPGPAPSLEFKESDCSME